MNFSVETHGGFVIPNFSTPQQDTQVNLHNLQHQWQLAAAFALSNWLQKSTKLSGRQLSFLLATSYLTSIYKAGKWMLVPKNSS